MCVSIKGNIIGYYYNPPILLACSIYHTKTVHILSTVTDNTTWTTTEKVKYGISLRFFIGVYYLSLNMIDYYNYGIVGVDLN